MSGGLLPIAALVMQAGGGLLQGIGANNEAKAGARVDEENARLSVLAGEQDSVQIRRDERMMAGDALAQMGGSGLAIGVGSPADILAESAMNRERDIAARRTQALQERNNYAQAAKDKRAAGRNALIGAAFGSVATALSGAADIRSARTGAQQQKKESKARG